MSLLDRMLDPNEATRIDVEGIRQHPWFRSPMGPQLQEAIDKMEAEQAANEVSRCLWLIIQSLPPIPHTCPPPSLK